MATLPSAIGPVVYNQGDLVLYEGQFHVVEGVQTSQLGYKTYKVSNVETGTVVCVAKHKLEAIHMEEVDDIPEMNWNVELGDLDDQVESVEVHELKPGASRYADLTDKDLDEVAKSRLSDRTERQTRWAVSLFKGNFS
jgi:hypothetical protein